MAVNRWRGDAPSVAKVITLVVGSATSTETFITTMNGKSIPYTAGVGETTSTVAAAIQALLAASDIPEFKEVTWTVDTATITGTAATAGMPFTVSKSGTGTYSLTTVTASSGPNHGDLAANWSLGALPTSTDAVLIDGGPDILWLDGLSGADYASWRVKASFEGQIGLPYRNANGYVEYRARFWPMNTAIPVTIGEGDGNGPTRVNIAITTAADITVVKTGTRIDAATPVVNFYGCASGTLNHIAGDVGIAADDDTLSATVTTATANDNATLTTGTGGTITTMNQDGATIIANGTITTLNSIAGETTLFKNPTTITADGGTIHGRFTGTLGTLTLRGQGDQQTAPRMDFSEDPRARTITNHTVTGGAILWDPDKTLTFSNAGTWDAKSLAASNLGARFSLLRS